MKKNKKVSKMKRWREEKKTNQMKGKMLNPKMRLLKRVHELKMRLSLQLCIMKIWIKWNLKLSKKVNTKKEKSLNPKSSGMKMSCMNQSMR